MGALIRQRDWRRSPLGPADGWPQSLRVAVSLALNCPSPMLLWWGPEFIQLYNDAYRTQVGADVHPAALGARGCDIWGDSWSRIGPRIDEVMAGHGATGQESALVPIRRRRRRDSVAWTCSYSPIEEPAAPHGVGGVLAICRETMNKALARQRQSVLLQIGDMVRDLGGPDDVISAVCRMLGETVEAGQVAYADIDGSGEHAVVTCHWSDGAMPSAAGRHRLEAFGRELAADLRAGRTVAVPDVGRDSRTSTSEAVAQFDAMSVRAFMAVPIMRRGRLAAVMSLHQSAVREWSDWEIALVESVAERTWLSVERTRAESALNETDTRLRMAQEVAGVGTFDWDIQANVNRWSPEIERLYGLPEGSFGGTFEDWQALVHPDDLTAAQRQAELALETGQLDAEWRAVRPDGRVIWLLARGIVEKDTEGRPLRMFGANVDITARVRAEQQQRMLMAELDHRVKNVLATVQSVVQQSLRGCDAEAVERLTGRLAALGHTHALLADGRWEGASLRQLLIETVSPYGGEEGARMVLVGPDTLVTPKAAQTLTMAFHELVTNASKYGALSTPQGRVSVLWTIRDGDGGRSLVLVWRESGGPGIERPPARKGFGTRLIEQTVAYDLGGQIESAFLPSGLLTTLELPLTALTARGGAGTEGRRAAAPIHQPADDDPARLAGKRVLVVEDQHLLALEVAETLRSAGCSVIGPAPDIARATRLAETEDFEAAVLDVNLDGDLVWPLAVRLHERGVPLVFSTGYAATVEPPPALRKMPRVGKPLDPRALVSALASVL